MVSIMLANDGRSAFSRVTAKKKKSTIIRNESMLQNVRERMKFTRQNRNIKYSTVIIFPKAKKDLLIESEVGKIQK